MNYIVIMFCIPLVWGLYKGFTNGLIIEAASFVAFGFGVWGAIHFSDFISQFFLDRVHWKSPYLPVVSFATTFLGIIILVYFIAKLIQHMVNGMALGAINKLLGAIFGAMKFAMVMSVIIFIIDAMEESYQVISFETKEKSLLYKPIGNMAPTLIPSLNKSKVATLLPKTKTVNSGLKSEEK